MALKSSLSSEEKTAEIEEALDALDKLVDRLKVMYEQYFMGIQKQAPAHLHTDAERRILWSNPFRDWWRGDNPLG